MKIRVYIIHKIDKSLISFLQFKSHFKSPNKRYSSASHGKKHSEGTTLLESSLCRLLSAPSLQPPASLSRSSILPYGVLPKARRRPLVVFCRMASSPKLVVVLAVVA
jgi:hypothetical protein